MTLGCGASLYDAAIEGHFFLLLVEFGAAVRAAGLFLLQMPVILSDPE